MRVHEIAESFQLEHTSQGQGNDRFICLRKKKEGEVKEDGLEVQGKEEEEEKEEEEGTEETNETMSTVPINKKKKTKKKRKPTQNQIKKESTAIPKEEVEFKNDIDLLEAAIERYPSYTI